MVSGDRHTGVQLKISTMIGLKPQRADCRITFELYPLRM